MKKISILASFVLFVFIVLSAKDLIPQKSPASNLIVLSLGLAFFVYNWGVYDGMGTPLRYRNLKPGEKVTVLGKVEIGAMDNEAVEHLLVQRENQKEIQYVMLYPQTRELHIKRGWEYKVTEGGFLSSRLK